MSQATRYSPIVPGLKEEERELVLKALAEGALNASGIALWIGTPRMEERAQFVLDAMEIEGLVRRKHEYVYEATGPVAADPAMPEMESTGRADSSTDDPHPTP